MKVKDCERWQTVPLEIQSKSIFYFHVFFGYNYQIPSHYKCSQSYYSWICCNSQQKNKIKYCG